MCLWGKVVCLQKKYICRLWRVSKFLHLVDTKPFWEGRREIAVFMSIKIVTHGAYSPKIFGNSLNNMWLVSCQSNGEEMVNRKHKENGFRRNVLSLLRKVSCCSWMRPIVIDDMENKPLFVAVQKNKCQFQNHFGLIRRLRLQNLTKGGFEPRTSYPVPNLVPCSCTTAASLWRKARLGGL